MIMKAGDDSSLKGDSSGDVKKRSDPGDLLKVEPRFAEGIDVGCEERVKDDCKLYRLASWGCH